ncbi:MAG: LysE family translocator [Anaerolineae bacterium]|nr:LysE family translocator [Anaerolineae bacterium]
MFTMLIAAFTIGVAVAIPPGPVTISGSQRAMTRGFWNACHFYLGSIISDAFYALLVYFGLSALLANSDLFQLGMWVVGGGWLIWIGIEAIRARIDLHSGAATNARSTRWHTFRSGFFLTLFNPLVIVSWVALAGNFFSTLWSKDWPPVESSGLIAILAMLAGAMAWVLALALILSAARKMIHPRLFRWISVGSGLFLVIYGLGAWWSALDMLV